MQRRWEKATDDATEGSITPRNLESKMDIRDNLTSHLIRTTEGRIKLWGKRERAVTKKTKFLVWTRAYRYNRRAKPFTGSHL
jgi:hypothetical protein